MVEVTVAEIEQRLGFAVAVTKLLADGACLLDGAIGGFIVTAQDVDHADVAERAGEVALVLLLTVMVIGCLVMMEGVLMFACALAAVAQQIVGVSLDGGGRVEVKGLGERFGGAVVLAKVDVRTADFDEGGGQQGG